MRIAVITTMAASPWGGSEMLWSDMARAALAAGHEVALFVYRWPSTPAPVEELAQQGAQVHRRRRGVRSRLEWMFPQIVAPLSFRNLWNWRPDVVCISMGSAFDAVLGGVWAVTEKLAHAGAAPYVPIVQATSDKVLANLSEVHRARGRRYFGQAAKTAFLSQIEIRMVERQLATRLDNATVLRNPINLADASPVPWPGDPQFHMASAARLHAGDKGHDVLFEVLGQPQWQKRNWRLRLYGEGASRAYFEQLTACYGISSRVQFAGYEPDVRKIWAENELLVMPSRSEGVSLALVEAMLCARPAVVTDVGGMREWIDDGRTGFLAHAATPLSFGVALERAWQSRDQLAVMGRQSHEFAIQHADFHAGQTLLRLLESVATSRANRAAA